jgi:hypothetical protein
MKLNFFLKKQKKQPDLTCQTRDSNNETVITL